jgi:hypothetical protein
MVSDRRLLVMSCSKRKFSDSGLLPAIERYAGPAFQVLNRFQRECPDAADYVDVFILSAAFGIIASSHPIPDYDQVMTRRRSRKLHTEALADFEALICDGYLDLCLAMSKKYWVYTDLWGENWTGSQLELE